MKASRKCDMYRSKPVRAAGTSWRGGNDDDVLMGGRDIEAATGWAVFRFTWLPSHLIPSIFLPSPAPQSVEQGSGSVDRYPLRFVPCPHKNLVKKKDTDVLKWVVRRP